MVPHSAVSCFQHRAVNHEKLLSLRDGSRRLQCITALYDILLDFSLTVKAATLIFISGCGSAISSAKEGKSGFIYNLVKSK